MQPRPEGALSDVIGELPTHAGATGWAAQPLRAVLGHAHHDRRQLFDLVARRLAHRHALSLGEESAEQLGIAVESDKRLVILLGSILTGAAVALGGLIGFVGLFAPHVTRVLIGPRHGLLLPASALLGAAFLVLADLLARAILSPTEIPVGILTAFVGGPFFLWLLRRERRQYRL